MSGHTPGPWSVGGITDTNGGDWTVVTGRFVVASVHNGVDFSPAAVGIPTSRQRANARLIAAAPELLAALEAMRDQFQYTSINDGDDEANRLAQAAIAKATT